MEAKQAVACACSREEQAAILSEVEHIIAPFMMEKASLIPILQKVQEKFGYLPEAALARIAKHVRVPECTVYGVATFYAQFKLVPSGRNIVRVCRGTACHVRGGARILREAEKRLGIKQGESTPDLQYGLETVACIGACALAPNITVNNTTYGQVTARQVAEIIAKYRESENDENKG